MRISHLAIILCFFLPALGSTGEPDMEWRRFPVTTVPHLPGGLGLDFDPAQATLASAISPSVLAAEGLADSFERTVFLAFDDEAFWVAFEMERPQEKREPSSPAGEGKIDRWAAGDAVELQLDPGRTGERYYNFVGYANGASADGEGRPGVDKGWNADFAYAARVTDRGWTGVFRIPFRSLGLEGPPKEDQEWGFDFIDNRRTPSAVATQWAWRSNWHRISDFGRLRFSRSTPAAQVSVPASAGKGHALAAISVTNPTDESAGISADIRLFRRKPGEAGGLLSYLRQIDSGREFEPGKPADYEMTTTVPQLAEEALRHYEPVGEYDQEQRNIPAEGREKLAWMPETAPGEYLFEYRIDSSGRTIAAGVIPFRVEAPLRLAVEPYWLKAGKLEVSLDHSRIESSADARVEIRIRPQDTAEPVIRKTVEPGKKSEEIKASLDVRELAVGYYEVEAVVLEGDREIAATSTLIEKPETPPWFETDDGDRIKVSKPWEPVRADKNGAVEVWGRTMDLGSFFPRRILSNGHAVIAAPVELQMEVAGEELAWDVHDFSLVEKTEAEVVYRARLENSSATLSGTVTAAFDGLLWYDLTFTPKSAPLKGSSVELLIPVTAGLSDLVNGPAASLGAVEGDLREAFTAYKWIGNENAGIAFVAEAPRDWLGAEKPIVISPSRNGEPASLKVGLVESGQEITRPLRWSFGLQATPIRKQPEMEVTFLAQTAAPTDDEEYYKRLRDQGIKYVNFHSQWKRGPGGAIDLDWGGWPFPPRTPEQREKLKKAVELAHHHGIKVLVYTGWGIAASSEEFRLYRNELLRFPVENSGFGTYRQSAGLEGAYADLMTYQIAQLIEDYDIDGVFFDSTSNIDNPRRMDSNLAIGNGWVDDKGRLRGSVPVLAHRELFRRVYNLFHGEKKDDGIVVNFGGGIWAVNAFADVFHRGEGTPMHALTLKEAWLPLEDYRANYSARPFGLPFLSMNKNFKNLPMTTNTHHAVTLLHGEHTKMASATKVPSYDRTAQVQPSIIAAWTWLPRDESTREFFYYDDATKEAIHLPEDSGLLSSAFVNKEGGRMLLVVSNLDAEAVEQAPVRLDFEKLGAGSTEADWTVIDAITGEPEVIKEGQLTLSVEGERYRFLKLHRQNASTH